MKAADSFRHDQQPCTGVLLTNLGTPDTPTATDVRRYLAEFLWDPRVVEIPRPLWWLILHGIILRTRPARSAAKYATVWTEAGSPLLDISKRQAEAVQQALDQHCPGPVKVVVAMRYGNPSIQAGLESFAGCRCSSAVVVSTLSSIFGNHHRFYFRCRGGCAQNLALAAGTAHD